MLHLYSKKIGLALLFSFCCSMLSAQVVENLLNYDKQKIHFGISLAFNQSQFKIERSLNLNTSDSILAVEPGKLPGFAMGIISNMTFGDNLDLRFIPMLSYGNRILEYRMASNYTVQKKVESVYIDFPLLLKFKSKRMTNFRFYLIGGGRFSRDMNSNAKAKDENANNLILVRPANLFAEYGVGTDFYMDMFKFSIEFKFSEGLRDVFEPKPELEFANVVDKLFPKTFMVSLHFE